MKPRSHLSPQERKLRSRLHFLLHQAGLLHASLITLKRKCGHPTCRCAPRVSTASCALLIPEARGGVWSGVQRPTRGCAEKGR